MVISYDWHPVKFYRFLPSVLMTSFCKALKIGLSVASSIEVTYGFSMVWEGIGGGFAATNPLPPQRN